MTLSELLPLKLSRPQDNQATLQKQQELLAAQKQRAVTILRQLQETLEDSECTAIRVQHNVIS